jgi:hypothetical protein
MELEIKLKSDGEELREFLQLLAATVPNGGPNPAAKRAEKNALEFWVSWFFGVSLVAY